MTKKEKPNIFIGVAWPYVNGDLHIGHLAGYLLPADIAARFFRATGHNVLMASGSDCFGTPITVEADKQGVTPKQIADTYHKRDVELFTKTLGLTYDIYTRTDTQNHIKVVQDFFIKLFEGGYIKIDTQKQYFSEKENRFLPDRYVEGKCIHCGFEGARSDQCDNCGRVLDQGELINPVSKLTGNPVELKDSQHYFVDWPSLSPQIEKFVKEKGSLWKNWVRQETLGWLKSGLKPRAITRDIDWGVPLPVDRIPKEKRIENIENKRLYVWFDAVIGYFSASLLWAKENSKSWEDYWYGQAKHYYFMGKDNLVFHTIFWPGQLIGYDKDLHLPDVPSVNAFLNFDGKQFSKSRGVTIPIKEIVEKYGNDAVRFYLTLIMPEVTDSSFRWNDFISKNNDVLVGTLGNFIHRVLSLAKGIDLKGVKDKSLSEETVQLISSSFRDAISHATACEFRAYLDVILNLADQGNKYVDYNKLWILKKESPEDFTKHVHELHGYIVCLAFLLSPVLPDASSKLFRLLGLKDQNIWPESKEFKDKLEELVSQIDNSITPTPLFNKFEEIKN